MDAVAVVVVVLAVPLVVSELLRWDVAVAVVCPLDEVASSIFSNAGVGCCCCCCDGGSSWLVVRSDDGLNSSVFPDRAVGSHSHMYPRSSFLIFFSFFVVVSFVGGTASFLLGEDGSVAADDVADVGPPIVHISLVVVVSLVSPASPGWCSDSLSDSSTMECSGSTLLGLPLSPLGPSLDERSRLEGRILDDDDAAAAGRGLKGGLLWIPAVVLRDEDGVKEWLTDAAVRAPAPARALDVIAPVVVWVVLRYVEMGATGRVASTLMSSS